MTIFELGALGEFVGAFAVVFTLIYLALQIRQNTKAVRASAIDVSISRANDVRVSMYENAEVSRIYMQGLNHPDELDEESRLRFRLLMHNVLLAGSNVYSQTSFAGLSLSTWDAQLTLINRVMTSPGGRWFWKEYRLEFEESFREQVDKILQAT